MTHATSLHGKLAVVTGVTSGIGEATALELLAAEAEVIGIGRDRHKLELASRKLGARFRPLLADLAEPAERKALLAELDALPRAPDIFIGNAAECVYESPLTLSAERLSRLFEVNVVAAVELSRGLSARMAVGAHVLHVSSVVARHLPSAKYAPYAASKVALECLTEALRLELHPRGIHVSLVAPGLVDTPIYDKLDGFARARAQIEQQVPIWLGAKDVAEAIVWILSRPAHVVISELAILPSSQPR